MVRNDHRANVSDWARTWWAWFRAAFDWVLQVWRVQFWGYLDINSRRSFWSSLSLKKPPNGSKISSVLKTQQFYFKVNLYKLSSGLTNFSKSIEPMQLNIFSIPAETTEKSCFSHQFSLSHSSKPNPCSSFNLKLVLGVKGKTDYLYSLEKRIASCIKAVLLEMYYSICTIYVYFGECKVNSNVG